MSPKKTKDKDWKKKRIIERLELVENKYYIFCEGEKTEPNYFEGFKRHIERNSIYKNLVLIEIEGVGADTERVIDCAVKYVKKNRIKDAQVWCVYDKDSFPSESFNRVNEIAENLNDEQDDVKYCVAWSNQCVEYWFVLHFNYYDVDNDREYYIENLNQSFKDKGLPKYEKAKDKYLFDKLTEHGNPKLAIRYAERRISDCCGKTDADTKPATKVYKLVQELSKYLPDDIIKRYI